MPSSPAVEDTPLQEQVGELRQAITRLEKRVKKLEQDLAYTDTERMRLERWVNQLAYKTGVKLTY
jgi:hypothetical protein